MANRNIQAEKWIEQGEVFTFLSPKPRKKDTIYGHFGLSGNEENITSDSAGIIKELGRPGVGRVVDSDQTKETEKHDTTKKDEEAKIFLTYDILCGKFREGRRRQQQVAAERLWTSQAGWAGRRCSRVSTD